MKLLDSDVTKFQALYRKYFSVDLDKNDARKSLALLVTQVEETYRPITRSQLIRLNGYGNERQRAERSSKKDI